MPGLDSRLGYSSRLLARCERDKVYTNVDIYTLVQRIVDNEARRSRHCHFLWLRTDLPSCLRELRDKMRREQVESVEDKTNVPFTLSLSFLVLSQRECKPGITISLLFFFNFSEIFSNISNTFSKFIWIFKIIFSDIFSCNRKFLNRLLLKCSKIKKNFWGNSQNSPQ